MKRPTKSIGRVLTALVVVASVVAPAVCSALCAKGICCDEPNAPVASCCEPKGPETSHIGSPQDHGCAQCTIQAQISDTKSVSIDLCRALELTDLAATLTPYPTFEFEHGFWNEAVLPDPRSNSPPAPPWRSDRARAPPLA